MRFFPLSLVLLLSTVGCADLLGFGDGGAGGSGAAGGSGGEAGSGGTATVGGSGGGGATGGGAGGSGGMTLPMDCIPDAMEPCFDGLPEIDGVGLCKVGSRTCQMDGVWGPCLGHVKPAVELCATPEDESCDGLGACTGGHLWSRRFGTVAHDAALGVTVDRDGNTIVVGETFAGLDLGQVNPQYKGAADLFVLKLDPEGNLLWGNTFGSGIGDRGRAVVTDAEGNIYVAGQGAAIDFPPGAGYESDGSTSALVVKLSPDGDVLWARSMLNAGADDVLTDIAAMPGGGVVVTGGYREVAGQTATFGGLPLPAAGIGANAVVAALAADGTVEWVKGYGDGTKDQVGGSIAVNDAGIVVVTASVQGSIDFGGGQLDSLATDFAVAALDGNAQGDHLWSALFGDAVHQRYPFVQASPTDNTFVLALPLVGKVDVGGGPMECTEIVGGVPQPCAPGDVDVAVWKWQLGAGGMTVVWQKHVPASGPHLPTTLSVDREGQVAVGGVFKGVFDFSGGSAPLIPPSTGARFAIKLDSGGGYVWQRVFGSSVDMSNLDIVPPPRVSADPVTGRVVLAGGFQGAVDFGGGLLQTTGAPADIAVVSLSP